MPNPDHKPDGDSVSTPEKSVVQTKAEPDQTPKSGTVRASDIIDPGMLLDLDDAIAIQNEGIAVQIVRKLKVIADIFEQIQEKPEKLNPVIADSLENEDLILEVKREAFCGVSHLRALLQRIDEKRLPARLLINRFSDEEIRKNLIQAIVFKALDYDIVASCAHDSRMEKLLNLIFRSGLLREQDFTTGETVVDVYIKRWLERKKGQSGKTEIIPVHTPSDSPPGSGSTPEIRVETHAHVDDVFGEEHPTLKRKALPPKQAARGHRDSMPEIDVTAEGSDSVEAVRVPAAITYYQGAELCHEPLFGVGDIATIGTDGFNDIIIDPAYTGIIAPIHGAVKYEEDGIYVKGEKGPLLVGTAEGKKRTIMTTKWEKVEDGQVFCLARLTSAKSGKNKIEEANIPPFGAEKDYELTREELHEELLKRWKRFQQAKAERVVKLLEAEGAYGLNEVSDELQKINEKISNIQKAGFQYGIHLFDDENKLTDALNESLQKAIDLVHKKLTEAIENFRRALFVYVEKITTSESSPDLDEHFIRKNMDDKHEAPLILRKIDELVDFAIRNKIPRIPKERREGLIAEAIASAVERGKEIRETLVRQKQAKETETRRFLEEKAARKRKHDELLAQKMETFPGGVFCAQGEYLDENTRFGYEGKVVKLKDWDNRDPERVDPLLFNITIGHHPSNTHKLRETRTPKYDTKPFMASIHAEPGEDRLIMTWIDGDLKVTGTGAVLAAPAFDLKKGQKVTIGPYHLSIEEGAYTEAALKQEGPRLAEALLKVIFDMDATSGDQDLQALKNLQDLVRSGVIDKEFVDKFLSYGMGMIWNVVGDWKAEQRPLNLPKDSPDANVELDTLDTDRDIVERKIKKFIDMEMTKKPLQDAHYLRTLAMCLDYKGDFIPQEAFKFTQDFELKINPLRQQARKRLEAYVGFYLESVKKESIGSKTIGALSAGSRKARVERLETVKGKAAAGKIQIARFIQMGLIPEKDLEELLAGNGQLASEYLQDIKKIIDIRNLIQSFAADTRDVSLIKRGKQLCTGKVMRNVFSPEEIEIDNHNIEVSLKEETPLEYYLEKLAVAVGIKALREASHRADPRGEVTVLNALFQEGLLKETDLVMMPTELEEGQAFLGPEEIRRLLKELFGNAHYLETVEQNKLEEEQNEATLLLQAEKHRHGLELQLQQKIAEENGHLDSIMYDSYLVLMEAREKNDLSRLVELADVMMSQQLAERMAFYNKSLSSVEKMERLPVHKNHKSNNLVGVTGEFKSRTWQEIRTEWLHLSMELGQEAVEKVMTGRDASYNLVMLEEAVEKGIFKYEYFNVTHEQMEEAIKSQNEKIREEKRVAKMQQLGLKYGPVINRAAAKIGDMGYLEQFKPDTVTDSDEKAFLKEIMIEINKLKLHKIIAGIQEKRDVAYMKVLAETILESGYVPDSDFTPEQLALLGIDK